MTHGSNTSNHHPLHPRDERETLSALFDGELPGDAARFALKRLDHDAGWRDTCGRWQLIGDALRGEATSAAPAGFAAGVMRKLAEEGLPAVAASPAVPVINATPAVVATRRRWLGGAALAASVAMVAVLVARPFSEPSSTSAQPQVAASAATPASTELTERDAHSVEVTAPVTTTAQPSATTTAVADTSSAATRRALRPARSALRPVRPSVEDPATIAIAAEPVLTQKPFHPPTDQVATRPWPRAVLPETGGGSFTVGFGATSAPTSSTSTPSLYPFEPRLPEAEAPPANEPQR